MMMEPDNDDIEQRPDPFNLFRDFPAFWRFRP
jgi:hypothetical protein